MKNRTIFLIIGIAMSLFAVGFIWVALQHPNYSFLIPLPLLYTIYLGYLIANISCYVIWGTLRRSEKQGETHIKTRTLFLILGIAMSLSAYLFIVFTSYALSRKILGIIYFAYFIINISCYVIWGVLRRKEK